MKSHTVMVSWSILGKGGRLLFKNKTFRNVIADSCVDACERVKAKCKQNVQINCVWYNV